MSRLGINHQRRAYNDGERKAYVSYERVSNNPTNPSLEQHID